MTVDAILAEMETLKFQVQFSILSGFQSLLRAYSHDPTVKRLLVELADDPCQAHKIFERIEYLLTEVDPRYYDESIAAYLFCLSKVNMNVAQQASIHILKIKGLWWSRRLALRLTDLVQQTTPP